ncbi:LysR family transcriptional regulator [Shinella daejeonensis]|uniref:LysR family transcriptional regulator n=1 Tax=Shinella daejeonensis TaxID=659017 RepID=UPI003F5CE1FE|nr:LysR family transcriptional regulator [Shinella daejeonensis]
MRQGGPSLSSVSTRIRALEEGLGILLFKRNTRGVRLTGAGPLAARLTGGR